MSDDRVFAKCAWRLLPLIMLAYITNYLDRTNLGMAALAMNGDLGFSPSVYGLGAGLFYISYSAFQVPANLVLHRMGARRWIFCILLAWGAAGSAGALIRGPNGFYLIRFLLGMAEAGFFPAIIFYLSCWFPKAWLTQMTAIFYSAAVLALMIGGPLGGLLLGLNGVAGIAGWRWLFLLEGLPAWATGIVLLKYLPDGPAQAAWLTAQERTAVAIAIQAESKAKDSNLIRAFCDPRVLLLGVAYVGVFAFPTGLYLWLPLNVQAMGFSNQETGFIVAFFNMAGVPGMILWARSSDRRSDRIWHFALAALFAAAALILASVAQNHTVRLLAFTGATIGASAMMSPFFSLPALFLSGRALAGGFALISAMGILGGGFAGQYAIGIIREQTGSFGAVFAVLSAALLISALIVLALGRAMAPRRLSVYGEAA